MSSSFSTNGTAKSSADPLSQERTVSREMPKEFAGSGVDLQPALQASSQEQTPFRQLPTSGTTCHLCGQVHPRGRFIVGCPGPRLQDGLRSAIVGEGHLPSQAETFAALSESRREYEADLGGSENLSRNHRDAVGDLLRLMLIEDYLFDRLLQGGPLTGKGRQRAALTAYLGVADRVIRLRQIVGLERRPRRVPTLDEALAAVAENDAR